MSVPEPQPLPSFIHQPGDPLAVSVRLRVGEVLHIELRPASGYRWSGIEASTPEVLHVGGAVGADGVAHFDVTAHSVGHSLLAATTQFQGDRFGPPTRRWTMSVEVTV